MSRFWQRRTFPSIAMVAVAALVTASCDEQSLEPWLAERGLEMVQRPTADLQPGTIFGFYYSSTREWAGMYEARDVAQRPANVTVVDAGHAWADVTPWFRASPEFMAHYLFDDRSAGELRRLGVETVRFAYGPATTRQARIDEVRSATCEAIVADAELPEGESAGTLGYLAPLQTCRSHYVMLSVAQVRTARVAFFGRRNRPVMLPGPAVASIAAALKGTLTSNTDGILTFDAPLIVAHFAVGEASVSEHGAGSEACELPQPLQEPETRETRDLLTGPVAVQPGRFFHLRGVSGPDALSELKSGSCLP